MDARHKKILQSSRSMLVRELDPSQLYDGLISRGIFSQDMIDEIKVTDRVSQISAKGIFKQMPGSFNFLRKRLFFQVNY
ncbi:UNVERIFIED_CONTAM: hypothetical protein FKN15_073941 [Acipenser sinensis]